MTTYLALDIGDKRIGLALGNDLAWLARPYRILERRSKREDFAALSAIVDEMGVDHLLIGLPRNMDGSEGAQAKRVRNYTQRLQKALGLPITFVDERLSSFEADLLIANSNKRRHTKHNDDVAAAVFLQAFLEQQRRQSGPPPVS